MSHKILLTLSLGLSGALLLTSTPALAGKDPDKVKEHIETCERATEDLAEASEDFAKYVAKVKEVIAEPVDDQEELSAKDWNKMITSPRSQAWRKEKDKVKAAIKTYAKSCKGITNEIKKMNKPRD